MGEKNQDMKLRQLKPANYTNSLAEQNPPKPRSSSGRRRINLNEDFIKAYDRACRYLGLKQRTEYEINNYLKNKNYQSDLVVKVILELKEEKFIDDKKYASDYIAQVLPHRPMGKILARQKLLRRGIKRELVEEVFQNEFSDELEKELARKLANKKIKISPQVTKREQYEKTARYLNSRGFPAGVIAEAIKGIIN